MRRALLALAALALVALGVDALRPPALPVPERRAWVFRDVVLVEPGAAPRPVAELRTRRGEIASISAMRPASAGEASDETRDLAGLFVSPGLIDMHVHYPPRVALGNTELWSLLFLAHGVTTVRETGSVDESVFEVRRAIERGAFPGPRIFACGAILDGDPPSFPSNRRVTTPAEARQAVRAQAREGADCIKVYNMLRPEVFAAIRDTAAAVGLPVIGHMPHSVPLEEGGLVDLQHGTGAVQVDRQRVGRLDFRAEDWAGVDDHRIAHVARLSAASGIAHTPTLYNARMRRWLVDAGAGDFVERDSSLRHLPRFWFDVWAFLWGPPFSPGDRKAEATHDQFRARQAALTAGLYAVGARIHAGTDTLMPYIAPGSSLHGELGELERAGIPGEAVWAIATREAGRSLAPSGVGTLREGAPADLLFLRENPADDLAALRTLEAVLVDGRLYRRRDLDAALAQLDAYFDGPVYRSVMAAVTAVARRGFAPGAH